MDALTFVYNYGWPRLVLETLWKTSDISTGSGEVRAKGHASEKMGSSVSITLEDMGEPIKEFKRTYVQISSRGVCETDSLLKFLDDLHCIRRLNMYHPCNLSADDVEKYNRRIKELE